MSVQTPHTHQGFRIHFDELEPEGVLTMRKSTFEALTGQNIVDPTLPVRRPPGHPLEHMNKAEGVKLERVPDAKQDGETPPDPLAHMDPDAPQDYTGPDKPVSDAPLPDHPAVENQPPEPPEPGAPS